jgi:hypothetical protein
MTDAVRERRARRTAEKEWNKKMDLLLGEMERTMTLELLSMTMVREKGPPYDEKTLLELAVKIFERKQNRSVREDAVLAWARKEIQIRSAQC